MTSRNRSISRAAAMSIERTTSANSTVTCLYSTDRLTCVTGAPHSLQNLEFGGSSVPHDAHDSPAISAPRPSTLGSTTVSCHRWSDLSVISALSCDVCRLCGYCLPTPLADGTKFAGYTILRLLGSGGMGEVYLAKHPRLPGHDALKVLPEDVSADPGRSRPWRVRGTALDRDGLRRWHRR